MNAPRLPPLGLYVHVPWCVRKCPYCDFNSHRLGQTLPEREYIDALIEDLGQSLLDVQDRALQSIFIGGGTPSLFSAAGYDRLLGAIEDAIPFADDIEITMEANPGTFEQQKFRDFRLTGINRLSIGVQSFSDQFLEALGRIHGGREAADAADIAARAGFDNINLDLMHGLPGQSADQALADLGTACAIGPGHLSWYQLTIEPNTEFYRRPPRLPLAATVDDMQARGHALLAEYGYARYEVSAYAPAGRQSVHNLNYWTFGDYLGIGAGAHGKITRPGDWAIVRTRKTRQPDHYLDPERDFTAARTPVAAGELPLEFMMNALRLPGGVEESLFEQRTGLPLATIAGQLGRLRERGLMEPDRLAPTARGFDLLNDVLQEFMP